MSDSPRSRIVDRVKQLAAVASVTAAGCGGAYGVVDPMPLPACFANRPPPKPSVARDGERIVVTLEADPAKKTNFAVAYCGIDKAPEGSLPIHTEQMDNTFSFTPPKDATAIQLHVRAWTDGCNETLFLMIHVDGSTPTVEYMKTDAQAQ